MVRHIEDLIKSLWLISIYHYKNNLCIQVHPPSFILFNIHVTSANASVDGLYVRVKYFNYRQSSDSRRNSDVT